MLASEGKDVEPTFRLLTAKLTHNRLLQPKGKDVVDEDRMGGGEVESTGDEDVVIGEAILLA